MNGYYKLTLLLDKRYNSVALVQSEIGSCTSWVCNNRSPLSIGLFHLWSRCRAIFLNNNSHLNLSRQKIFTILEKNRLINSLEIGDFIIVEILAVAKRSKPFIPTPNLLVRTPHVVHCQSLQTPCMGMLKQKSVIQKILNFLPQSSLGQTRPPKHFTSISHLLPTDLKERLWPCGFITQFHGTLYNNVREFQPVKKVIKGPRRVLSASITYFGFWSVGDNL